MPDLFLAAAAAEGRILYLVSRIVIGYLSIQ